MNQQSLAYAGVSALAGHSIRKAIFQSRDAACRRAEDLYAGDRTERDRAEIQDPYDEQDGARVPSPFEIRSPQVHTRWNQHGKADGRWDRLVRSELS